MRLKFLRNLRLSNNKGMNIINMFNNISRSRQLLTKKCRRSIRRNSILPYNKASKEKRKLKHVWNCCLRFLLNKNALPKTFEVAVRFEVTVLSDILGTTVEGAEKKAEFCKFRGLGEASETL